MPRSGTLRSIRSSRKPRGMCSVPGIMPWACSSGSRTSISAGRAVPRSAASSAAGSISGVFPRSSRSSVSKVNEIRDAEAIEATMALRLRVVGGGCAGFSYDLYFDEPTEVDRQFVIQDVKVVVDEMSLMYLVGTEIDYVEGLQGAGFKFNNPNVKTTCGCGSSFSV